MTTVSPDGVVRDSLVADRSWWVAAAPDPLWERISTTVDYAEWWPWLRAFEPVLLVTGTRVRFVVSPPLPYALGFEIELTAVVVGERLEARVRGDVEGSARLDLRPDRGGTAVSLRWQLRPRRHRARVLRPLLRAGHDLVLARAAAQFTAATGVEVVETGAPPASRFVGRMPVRLVAVVALAVAVGVGVLARRRRGVRGQGRRRPTYGTDPDGSRGGGP